jgi:hypothetical protein
MQLGQSSMDSSGSGGGLGIGQTYFEAFMKKKITFTEDEAMHYFTMILISLHYLHKKKNYSLRLEACKYSY